MILLYSVFYICLVLRSHLCSNFWLHLIRYGCTVNPSRLAQHPWKVFHCSKSTPTQNLGQTMQYRCVVWICGTVEQWKRGSKVWSLAWLMICSYPMIECSSGFVELWNCGIVFFYDYYFIEHRGEMNIAYNMFILPRDCMFIPPLTIVTSYHRTIVVVGRNWSFGFWV